MSRASAAVFVVAGSHEKTTAAVIGAASSCPMPSSLVLAAPLHTRKDTDQPPISLSY
uniref:Uncharacterized protein n=1 Tax=Arundo donax TaxID=35708 RepID=A0A0A8YD66_ARUDO